MKRLFLLLMLLQYGCGLAQAREHALDSTLYETRGAVVLDDDTLFHLYDNINGINARERASLVNLRLQALVRNDDYAADSFRVRADSAFATIFYRNKLMVNITATDANWYGSTAGEIAEQWAETLRVKCTSVSSALDIKAIIIQIVMAILAVLISALIIKYVNRLFRVIKIRIQKWKGTVLKGVVFRSYEMLNADRQVSILLLLTNLLRIFTLVFIFYLTLPVVLKIFPWTEGIADMLFGFVLNPLKRIVMNIVGYIPNLFTILVIFFVIRYITKGVRFLADEIRHEKLKIQGFFPDWAVPTARIINFVLYAFMLVLIWPYLPGSDSPIFKGVSVFLGLLISIGSSSAISNIVAGLVITYMRPFQVGDRVRIGEVNGDVIQKNLLVTRVKTIKNEIITVPNSNILNNSSINYSISSESSQGLIINTSVTIGYDVPWRKVHRLLIEAAERTPLILEQPRPFVLQTSLDDFYVSYQINAYTHSPEKQAVIYSDLHALIQDGFANEGVEIMSPHYRAERPGPNTIPPQNGQ